MVEAVDRLAQPLRPEILINRGRLAFDRALDRRIVKHRHAAIGPDRSQLVLELARFVERLVDERLADRLSERRQLAATEAAEEALYAGEPDALDLMRLLVENDHSRGAEDFGHLFRLPAFVIVVPEHAEHRNRAGADILG